MNNNGHSNGSNGNGNGKHPGQPTKYKPEYCKAIIAFFSQTPYTYRKETVVDKFGKKKTTQKEVPNDLPLFSRFAHSLDVNTDSLNAWTKVHPEFSDAYKRAKELQEAFLVTNTLRENFAQPFAIFAAKNMLGWRDRQEIVELKFVLDFTGRVVGAINQVLPDKCASCGTLHGMKGKIAAELEKLSKQIEGAAHAV